MMKSITLFLLTSCVVQLGKICPQVGAQSAATTTRATTLGSLLGSTTSTVTGLTSGLVTLVITIGGFDIADNSTCLAHVHDVTAAATVPLKVLFPLEQTQWHSGGASWSTRNLQEIVEENESASTLMEKEDEEDGRSLANMCANVNCKKQKSWNYCMTYGCSCPTGCGQRRRGRERRRRQRHGLRWLQSSSLLSPSSLLQLQLQIDIAIAPVALANGCFLESILEIQLL
jgi:hypothetical protein